MQEITTEIEILSDAATKGTVQSTLLYLSHLHRLSEATALLDMLSSFAQLASCSLHYVRPEFAEAYAVQNGYHPILQKWQQHGVIANGPSPLKFLTKVMSQPSF